MESEESLPTKKMGDRLKKQRNFILDAWLSFVKKFFKIFILCCVNGYTGSILFLRVWQYGGMIMPRSHQTRYFFRAYVVFPITQSFIIKQLSSAVRVINHAVVVNSLEVCGFAEST